MTKKQIIWLIAGIVGTLFILGMLIISAFAWLGIRMMDQVRDEAKVQRTMADIKTIELALMGYQTSNGGNPPTEAQGLRALVERPTSDPQPMKWRAYLKESLLDPWGNPYHYRYPATKSKQNYDIWSNGENGIEDSGEVSDDVGNW